MNAFVREHGLTFVAGIVITAAVWWLTEKLLDRHIGPKVNDGVGLL